MAYIEGERTNDSSPRQLGRFRLLSRVGAGSMGEIYEAEDTALGRRVALKLLPAALASDARRLSRFATEARALAALDHPNIVAIHSVEEVDGQRFFVMELVSGSTLAEVIPPAGFPAARLLELALPLADALATAHRSGIVHRDLKPANVMVTADDRLKVLDFGLAKLTQSGGEATDLDAPTDDGTQPGTLLGTLAYIAPEQYQGASAGVPSDVFSLGVILYEMATGRRPFAGASSAELIHSILHSEPQQVRTLNVDVPPEFEALVHECLAKDPRARPASAVEVRERLARLAPPPAPPRAESSSAAEESRERPRVAVLPFADMSVEHDQTHLCDGLAEEIINALVKVPGLRVVARTSSFRFRAADADVREIGSRLGVSVAVLGSVRRSGQRVRVSAQLVDTSTGFHLWSEVFERTVTDLFTLEDEIAAAIARTLATPSPGAPSAPQSRTAPVRGDALELYHQGRFLWGKRPGKVVWDALECFRRAVEIDPGFALAWAGLADVYATLGSWESGVLPHDDAQTKAHEFATRALAIAPDLPEALTTLAYTTLHYRWDTRAAEQGFLSALAAGPGNAAAHHWYSHCLVAAGRVEESLAQSKAALVLDPMNLLMSVHLAWHHFMARQPGLTLEQSERVLRLDRGYHWGHFFAGWGAEGLGEHERSLASMLEATRCSEGNPVMRAGLARALALTGDRREALRVARELEQGGSGPDLFAYEIALVHQALGDRDQAFAYLDRARRARSGWLAYLPVDPRLDPLRGDPRMPELSPPIP